MSVMKEMDTKRWDKFWSYWKNDLADKYPQAKKDAMEAIGEALLQEVRGQVDRQGIKDVRGRVKTWQQARTGSGGGYVAVSAAPDVVAVSSSGKKTTAAAVTGYLERGHPTRQPSGRSKRYVPSENMVPYARAYRFYSYSKMNAVDIALHAADKLLCRIADDIEDAAD